MKHHHLLLAVGLALWPLAALADEDASLPDVPDASAGSGGADMTSEENDPNQTCLSSSDCDAKTSCVNGRCVPGKVRNAAGCGGGAWSLSTVASAGVGLVLLRRKSRNP